MRRDAVFVLNLSDIIFLRTAPHIFQQTTDRLHYSKTVWTVRIALLSSLTDGHGGYVVVVARRPSTIPRRQNVIRSWNQKHVRFQRRTERLRQRTKKRVESSCTLLLVDLVVYSIPEPR